MSGFAVLLIVALCLCVYFLPWIVAKNRDHHNSLAIFWLTFFFGWSVIGWVGALIWACTSQPPQRS